VKQKLDVTLFDFSRNVKAKKHVAELLNRPYLCGNSAALLEAHVLIRYVFRAYIRMRLREQDCHV
jgi:hypothetical protein